MRLFTFCLTSIVFFMLPFFTHGAVEVSPQSYVELGIGITQHQAVDDSSTETELPQSVAGKVLVGGKVISSSNVWFELMYNYDSKTKYSDTNFEYSSQTIATGLKLTSNPYKELAGFTRFGIGQTRFDTRNSGVFSSASKNQAYVGAGMSYRLTKQQYFNVEYQLFHYFDLEKTAIDENNGSLFFSYQHYLN